MMGRLRAARLKIPGPKRPDSASNAFVVAVQLAGIAGVDIVKFS
jgi:hypothetical protein